MLKIYGVPRSRTFRTLWMAKELGLDYENIPIDFANDGTRAPEYLRVNPNGHDPTIDDDGFILWESMAINLYLAKKYGRGDIYPILFEDEARAWQWSFWGMTEIEQTFVLEGSLVDDEGEVRAGNYVWRPKGNRHIARSPLGALVLSMFLKPNIFLAGDATSQDLR